MGSPLCQYGRGAYSEDEVQVTLTHAFEIADHETTQFEWTTVGFANPSHVGSGGFGNCLAADCPVGYTNWFEALAYANRRSEVAGLPVCYSLSGCSGTIGAPMVCSGVAVTTASIYDCQGYRLPTEAEWEYAARAGTRTPFYTGEMRSFPTFGTCGHDPALEAASWYCINAEKLTHPVKLKVANSWGLFDMLGNSEEWVGDHFNGLGYPKGPLVDPFAAACTASFRLNRAPELAAPGLRLARTLPSPDAGR